MREFEIKYICIYLRKFRINVRLHLIFPTQMQNCTVKDFDKVFRGLGKDLNNNITLQGISVEDSRILSNKFMMITSKCVL